MVCRTRFHEKHASAPPRTQRLLRNFHRVTLHSEIPSTGVLRGFFIGNRAPPAHALRKSCRSKRCLPSATTVMNHVLTVHSAILVQPAFDCPFMRRTHAEIQFRYRCRSCRENLFLILLGANSRDLSGSITADKAGARGWRVRVDMHSYAACRGPVFRSPPECSRSAARSRSR